MIEEILNWWTHRFLTLSGRILLIKYLLITMYVYLFLVLTVASNILQNIFGIKRILFGEERKGKGNGNW
jgi:hypothetical protein